MRIVEDDFILNSNGGLFDLVFLKEVKNKDSGETEIKQFKGAYGCTLSSALNRIVRRRINTIYASETPCLLEALNKIIKLEEEIVTLCKDCIPEKFDTGE